MRMLSLWAWLLWFGVARFLIVETGGGDGGGPISGGAGISDNAGAAGVVDVEAAVRAALATQEQEFKGRFKAATGHESFESFQEAEARRKGEEGQLLEQRTAELTALKTEIERGKIESAIRVAASEAVDPDVVLSLLAAGAKVEGNAVIVGGKPAAEAVKELLSSKPYLAKPAGPAGSGAGPVLSGGNAKTLEQFRALDPVAKLEFTRNGGRIV